MRILVLSNKCPPDYDGGYELSAFQVAGALRSRGYEVTLLTSHFRSSFSGPRDQDPSWVKRLFDYREWPHLAKKGPGRFFEDAKRVSDLTAIGVDNAAKLETFLSDTKFDLAYCFGLHGIGLATAYPLKKQRIPTLWHAGNYLIAQDMQLKPLLSRRRLAHRIAMHFMSGKAKQMTFDGDYSHIAFLSEAMRKSFVRMGGGWQPKLSYIIPRGIDFPLSENVSAPREPIFLMASRIGPEKGHEVVIQACGDLAKQSQAKWQLRIAGSGQPEYVAVLKNKVKDLGIEDRVHFAGMLGREAVLEEMRRSYAFISASIWEEPFGRTNIESLACGATLVAADTGAIQEIVGNSGCALIYEKTSAPALTKILDDLLKHPHERSRLAELGIQRIKDAYTMNRILDMTEDVFGKVMADYGKPFNRPKAERGNS